MANSQPYPLVSIVILNWNGLDDTKICLDHVFKLDYPNFEVIVLDNGSKTSQKEYLSKQKNIIYVDNPKNTGFAGGHDDALPYTHGEFILLLNNDAVIQSNYLKQAMRHFDDPKVAVVGGRSYFWNDDAPLFDESNPFYAYMSINPISAETTLMTQDYGVVQEVNTVSGSSVVVRKSVINELGYLYRPFFAYYEETDLFARYKRAGYHVLYDPKLHIWHKNGASSGAQGGSSFFYYHIFRNRFMFALRNFDKGFLPKFLKNYYKSFIKSLLDAPRGPVQRRLATSYAKAVGATIKDLPIILRDRKELAKSLSTAYSQQILDEQVAVSLIIDATNATQEELSALENLYAHDTNPLHEYIVITKDDTRSSSRIGNFRYVVDRHYFAVSPLNIGVVAASYDWVVLSDTCEKVDLSAHTRSIAATYDTNIRVIPPSSILPNIAIAKSYLQKMGGVTRSRNSLAKNIAYITDYATFEHTLFGDATQQIKDSHSLHAQVSYDNHLLSLQTPSRWLTFLAHHYRALQLTNLLSWLFNLKIALRLKLARLKNLFLFAFTLRRKLLATELKHIRNEAQIYSQKGGALKISHEQSLTIKKITRATRDSISEIPIFIICFERVNTLKVLVQWLERAGHTKIIFLDNDSTYKPLLEYYEQSPYQVIRLYRNVGHTGPWSLGAIRMLVPDQYYIVTDPDVIPNEDCPTDAISHFLDLHKKNPSHIKVGFGLKIDDLPDYYPLKQSVIEWEGQFWKDELTHNVFEAGLDTTFALYKPFTYFYTLNPSLRTGEPYTARHMPWYANPLEQTEEDRYYKLRASANVTSWNVDELPDRYKKEMGRAKK